MCWNLASCGTIYKTKTRKKFTFLLQKQMELSQIISMQLIISVFHISRTYFTSRVGSHYQTWPRQSGLKFRVWFMCLTFALSSAHRRSAHKSTSLPDVALTGFSGWTRQGNLQPTTIYHNSLKMILSVYTWNFNNIVWRERERERKKKMKKIKVASPTCGCPPDPTALSSCKIY